MIKHGLEKINIENPIDKSLPMLIDYFVNFYGEKYRERITDRLNSATYVFTDCAGNIDTYNGIKKYFDSQKENLIKDFYRKIGVVAYKTNPSLLNFKEWIDILKNYDKQTFISKDLSEFLTYYLQLKETDEGLQLKHILNDKDLRQNIIKTILKFEQIYKSSYKESFDYIDSEFERISTPYKEIYEKTQKINEKYKKSSENLIKNYLETTFELKGNSTVIENYKQILSARTVEFLPSECLELVKQLANLKNFKYRTTHESLKDIEFKKLLLNGQLTKELEKLDTERTSEILELNTSYKNLEKELSEGDIYRSQILPLLEDFIMNSGNIVAYVEHTYKLSSPSQPYAVCVLPSLFSLNNVTLIHELNHIVTCDILQNLPYSVYYKCGFHTGLLDKDINLFIGNKDASMLNEVINDYIAVKINEMMEKDNIGIGLLPNTPSPFARAFPLLEDFIKDNFETIIECCMSEDDSILTKRFGLEELEILGQTICNFLYNNHSSEIQQEILFRTQADKINYFVLLNDDDYNWSDYTKEYLNYFRTVDLVNKRIKLNIKASNIAHSKSNSSSISTSHKNVKRDNTVSNDNIDFRD